jgi:CSLREA domain-containing protein
MNSKLAHATIVSILCLAIGQAAGAATYNVTKQADTRDGNCNADCSLREAIIAANANPGFDTVIIPAGTFTMSIAGIGEEAALTGDFDVTDDALVQGAGRDQTIVDGDFVDRVFDTFGPGFATPIITIRDLTITGGTCVCGGGVWSSADLTMINVRVTDSNADTGGGICNSNVLTLIDVTLDNNTAADWGGAIDNAFANAFVSNSTFRDNTAGDAGGAVCNENGFFEATNSTFAGNSAPSGGMFWNSGTGIFHSSTIADNAALNSQRAFINATGGVLEFSESLLRNTPGGSCNTPTGVMSLGYNLDSGASCGLTSTGDRQGTNPKLDTLKNNGGPTKTMALLSGSPAIDGGSSSNCPQTDQRGEARPADGDDDGQAACDIGAFEVQEPAPWVEALALGADVALGREGSARVEVRDGDTAANLNQTTFLVGFTPVAIATVPDATNNGIDEIAVAAIRDSDGRYAVEFRNATGVAQTQRVWFGSGFTPVDLVVVPDADNNGVPDLAVLAMRNSDGRAVVELRNATGPAQMRRIWYTAGFTPHELLLTPDVDGNGVDELVAALTRNSDGRAKAELRNAAGAAATRSVWFNASFDFVDLAFVPGETPKLGMLALRDSDNRPVVEVRRLLQGTRIGNVFFFDSSFTAVGLEVLANQDANNAPELVVLAERSDGRPVVDIKNAFGAANSLRLFFLDGTFDALQVIVIDDADGNQVSELGVLGRRTSDGRYVIQRKNASGSAGTGNIWFSP